MHLFYFIRTHRYGTGFQRLVFRDVSLSAILAHNFYGQEIAIFAESRISSFENSRTLQFSKINVILLPLLQFASSAL